MNIEDKSRSINTGSDMMDSPSLDYSSAKRGYICSVTSGKGGTGKTISIINLALSFRKLGKKVLIIDGDMGMANVDIILGLKVRYHLEDVFKGNQSFQDVTLEGPDGIRVVPGGSGIQSLQRLSYVQQQVLKTQLVEFQNSFDIVLLDTGAGISSNVLHLNSLAHRRIVVTTPEPHALADAYALIKVLTKERGVTSFDLVVNMAKNSREAASVAERIKKTADSFLAADIRYLGFIPSDEYLSNAVLGRTLGQSGRIQSLSGQAFHQITLKLLESLRVDQRQLSTEQFWGQALKPDTNQALDNLNCTGMAVSSTI